METKIREFANEMCSVWCRADALYGRWAVQKHINYFVLLVLWVLQINSGGMTQKKISQYYGWPKQTTNSAIRTLKQEGMILLLPETADKREKKVILSEKGAVCQRCIDAPVPFGGSCFWKYTGGTATGNDEHNQAVYYII